MLIKTATDALNVEKNTEYLQFLQLAVDAIPLLIDSSHGQLVIQCLLYYVPSLCDEHIKTYASLQWIFNKMPSKRFRFEDASYWYNKAFSLLLF